MVISRIICLIIGYIFGLFQTGYFYGKTQHIDIRRYGSGNSGTTNTLRTLGWKAGAVTFLGDLLKAMLAILVVWLIFRERYPEGVKVLQMYAGLGAVLGHNYPFYMNFKGGKGIACTAGYAIACFWQVVPICLLLFVIPVAITKYVSLGSILIVIGYWIQLVIFGQMGLLPVAEAYLPEVYIVGAVFSLLALWRHRENIKRLLTGRENKFVPKKKEE